MNKMKATMKETYETPAIQDIPPVTTGVVQGLGSNDPEPDYNDGSSGD